MKKRFAGLAVAVLVFGGALTANATVMGTGHNYVVYDDISEKFWVNSLQIFTGLTYDDQVTAIGTLNSNGLYSDARWTNWHMASGDDIGNLFSNGLSNLTSSFTATLNDNNGTRNWYGRFDEVRPHDYYALHGLGEMKYQTVYPDHQYTRTIYSEVDSSTQPTTSVWIVADMAGGPMPTPEPTTIVRRR